MKKSLLFFALSLFTGIALQAQLTEGPFDQLIIRGVTLINGNGAPPVGPVDVVVENETIVKIATVGYPGVEINQNRRPQLKKGGKELMLRACIFYLVLSICMGILEGFARSRLGLRIQTLVSAWRYDR